MSISEYNEKHQAHIPQNAEFESGFRAALADARRVTDPHDYIQHHFNVEEMKNTLRNFSGKLGGRRSRRQIESQGGIGSSLISKGATPAGGPPQKFYPPPYDKPEARPSTPPYSGNTGPVPKKTKKTKKPAPADGGAGGGATVDPAKDKRKRQRKVQDEALQRRLKQQEERLELYKWQLQRIWWSSKNKLLGLPQANGALTRIRGYLKKYDILPENLPEPEKSELADLLAQAQKDIDAGRDKQGSAPPDLGRKPETPTNFMDSDEEEEVSPMDVEDTTLGVEDISLDDVLDEYGEEAEHYEEATTGVSSLHEEIDAYLKSNAKDDASFARDRAHVIHFNTVSTHLPARLMKGRDRYMKRLKAYLDGDTSAKVRMLDNTEVLVSALSPNADSLRALLKASSGEPRFCECT